MLCYKDRSFCSCGDSCIYKNVCARVLTTEMLKEAQELGLPISYFEGIPMCYFGSSKVCGEYVKVTNTPY